MGRIALAWNASTDNVGVAGYHVFLNGNHVNTTGATAWTYLGLVCGSTYLLQVSAFDAAGNLSGRGSIQASTLVCPPLIDQSVLEDESGDGGYFWTQGTGVAYLTSLTEPGGDRGRRSKTGCGYGDKKIVRRGFTYVNVLYRVTLRGTWCWRSVWDSSQRRHVPEIYDVQAECKETDVDGLIVIDSSCRSPSVFFRRWNGGERGKVEISAAGHYRNCVEGLPLVDGCFPWKWHETLMLTFYGDGTWRRN